MIKCFGPMYIDFDEYPCYSGINSNFFEMNVNENIQCVHGYAYHSGKQKICTWVNEDSWEMMKNCFPDAKPIKKIPWSVLCKECTYDQKDINGNDEKLIPQKILNILFLIIFSGKTCFYCGKYWSKVKWNQLEEV